MLNILSSFSLQIDEKRVTSNGGFVSPPKPNQGAFRTMSYVLWATPMDNITVSSYEGDVAALTRSSLIWWENNTPNNKTVDPSPENNRAAWYQGPMKLEVVKSCGATQLRYQVTSCILYQNLYLCWFFIDFLFANISLLQRRYLKFLSITSYFPI